MRTTLAILLLLSAGCGGAAADGGTPALAAPVVVPMQARERLLHDLELEQQKARDRAGTLDEAIGSDR